MNNSRPATSAICPDDGPVNALGRPGTLSVAPSFTRLFQPTGPMPAPHSPGSSDNVNFAGLLSQSGARWAARAAISDKTGTTSFRELVARASAFAAMLQDRIEPGDRVGIFLERGADAAAAFFGVLAAGGVAININERLRPRQVEHILDDSSTTILLTSEDLLSRQPRPLVCRPDVVTNPVPPGPWVPVPKRGNDLAHIIYTSGSTGLAKGVMVSHANLWAGTRIVSGYLEISSEDRIASLLPFTFDYGLNQLLCAVNTGAELVVETAPLADQIVATLAAKRITVLPGLPPIWLQLLTVPAFRKPLPDIRIMTNTGGAIPAPKVAELRAAQPHAKLFLMYGLTEAFRATYLPPDEVDRRPNSIGRAIPESEVLVVDEAGRLCPPGVSGELVQAGPTVALGYWKNPDATAKVFRPHPRRQAERAVYSGDLVRADEEGFLYFVGRRDKMIKTLGYRVSPDEVSEVLYRSGEVVEAVVGAEPDAARGMRIIAHVVLTANGSLNKLKSYCRMELPNYAVPARIDAHAALPRTASGKHDVSSLS
jgi:amino acid adenylation domain-containing protein